MALLESTSRRTRAAAAQRAPRPNRFAGIGKAPQSWRENLREVGNTMLTLILVAIGIVVLRYLLVVAYGLLH